MALSQSLLETQLNSFLSAKITYTTLAQSAIAFALAYSTFAASATANGQPLIPPSPTLISDTIISMVPPFDPGGTLWATAVGIGISSYWAAATFNPVPGPISIASPPVPTTMSAPLLAAMLSTYILPGTTDSIVAASMATILYAALIPSTLALVIPPFPGSPYTVPVI